jgi:hypothetical protein
MNILYAFLNMLMGIANVTQNTIRELTKAIYIALFTAFGLLWVGVFAASNGYEKFGRFWIAAIAVLSGLYWLRVAKRAAVLIYGAAAFNTGVNAGVKTINGFLPGNPLSETEIISWERAGAAFNIAMQVLAAFQLLSVVSALFPVYKDSEGYLKVIGIVFFLVLSASWGTGGLWVPRMKKFAQAFTGIAAGLILFSMLFTSLQENLRYVSEVWGYVAYNVAIEYPGISMIVIVFVVLISRMMLNSGHGHEHHGPAIPGWVIAIIIIIVAGATIVAVVYGISWAVKNEPYRKIRTASANTPKAAVLPIPSVTEVSGGVYSVQSSMYTDASWSEYGPHIEGSDPEHPSKVRMRSNGWITYRFDLSGVSGSVALVTARLSSELKNRISLNPTDGSDVVLLVNGEEQPSISVVPDDDKGRDYTWVVPISLFQQETTKVGFQIKGGKTNGLTIYSSIQLRFR